MAGASTTMLYNEVFASEQSATDFEAISYAAMDKHHYGNSCDVNVDSVEVFVKHWTRH